MRNPYKLSDYTKISDYTEEDGSWFRTTMENRMWERHVIKLMRMKFPLLHAMGGGSFLYLSPEKNSHQSSLIVLVTDLEVDHVRRVPFGGKWNEGAPRYATLIKFIFPPFQLYLK